MQSEYEKTRTRITPNTDTFYAVNDKPLCLAWQVPRDEQCMVQFKHAFSQGKRLSMCNVIERKLRHVCFPRDLANFLERLDLFKHLLTQIMLKRKQSPGGVL